MDGLLFAVLIILVISIYIAMIHSSVKLSKIKKKKTLEQRLYDRYVKRGSGYRE